jgi:type IV pilus assembly protein PilX
MKAFSMRMFATPTFRDADRQQGAVLIVGLIFLALLTLIGVTAFSVATQEERMAGNSRDRLRAFEAAEAALRECERLLSNPVPPVFSASGSSPDVGMYMEPAIGAREKWESINWSTDPTRQLTGVANVAEQPRCIVQRLARTSPGNPSRRAELPQPSAFAYQVTGRGVGANRNTAVVLQTTFIRD